MQSAFGDLQPLEVRGRAFARAGAKAADGASRGGAGNAGKERRRRSGKVNVNSAAPSATRPSIRPPRRYGCRRHSAGGRRCRRHAASGRACRRNVSAAGPGRSSRRCRTRRAAALQAEDRRVRLLRRDILVAESDFRLASAAHSLREISKERSVEVSLTRGKFFNATLPSLTLISRPTSTLHFFGIGGGGDRRRSRWRPGRSANRAFGKPRWGVVRRHRQDAADGRFALQPVHRPEIQGGAAGYAGYLQVAGRQLAGVDRQDQFL